MTIAKLLAALATAALATLAGCSGVEKCLEGVDPGCLGSAPDDSGNCKYGLTAPDGLICTDGKDIVGNDAGGGGTPDSGTSTCSCPSGQLCRSDGTCVNLCLPVASPPVVKPTPLPCAAPEGTTESFARIALALCTQSCVHRAIYCNTTCNPDTECTQLLASAAARASCQGMEDQACATNLCKTARDLPCTQQQCPPGSALSCTGTSCSDACDQYNDDGICDDGDPSNALSYVCDFGTDCGDCGPRRGSAAPTSLQVGDVCTDPAQCGGDITSVKSSDGWCVPATDNQDYSRCIPDCSNGKKCPSGFDCTGIASADPDGDGPMTQMQYQDVNDGTKVYGCFPSQCGG